MEASSDEPPPIPFPLTKTPSTTSFYEMPREPRLKLLVAANGPREVAYAQSIAVRLSKEPKITTTVIADVLTHRLVHEFPSHVNCGLRTTIGSSSCYDNSKETDAIRQRAFELVAWADLLVLAPIDADHLARMMAGIADTLLLEVLRSWDASKRILLVPGMSTHMWENPVTKRQMSKLHRKWHWIRVLPPILWHYDTTADASANGCCDGARVYLPGESKSAATSTAANATGATSTAAVAAQAVPRKRIVEWTYFNDLIGLIKNHAELLTLGHDVDVSILGGRPLSASPSSLSLFGCAVGSGSGSGSGAMMSGSSGLGGTKTCSRARLPPEIWTLILEHTGDWELAQALNVYTSLPMPTEAGWRATPRDPNDPLQVFMHELEWTLLTGDSVRVCRKLAAAPTALHDLSVLAIKLVFKFVLVDVLRYIEAQCPLVFRNFCGKIVPTKASAYCGRTEILDWWVRSPSFLEKQYDADAMDGASKHGYVHVLEWWRRSGLPLKYTEAALEQASAKGHVRVLEWWREASLASAPRPIVLKPGRSLICAAQYGRVAVLRWWEEKSGVDAGHQDSICKVASRWGQVEVLEALRELRGDDKITFNHLVLVEATMHSHLGVLDWWKRYAHGQLPGMDGRRAKQVEYRTMDIEEALEDALGDQTAVRRWWAENGLNLGLGTSEWMKSRYL